MVTFVVLMRKTIRSVELRYLLVRKIVIVLHLVGDMNRCPNYMAFHYPVVDRPNIDFDLWRQFYVNEMIIRVCLTS